MLTVIEPYITYFESELISRLKWSMMNKTLIVILVYFQCTREIKSYNYIKILMFIGLLFNLLSLLFCLKVKYSLIQYSLGLFSIRSILHRPTMKYKYFFKKNILLRKWGYNQWYDYLSNIFKFMIFLILHQKNLPKNFFSV